MSKINLVAIEIHHENRLVDLFAWLAGWLAALARSNWKAWPTGLVDFLDWLTAWLSWLANLLALLAGSLLWLARLACCLAWLAGSPGWLVGLVGSRT